MRKSIFKKFLISTSVINLLCFLGMAALVFFSVSNYYVEDHLELLSGNAETVALVAEKTAVKTERGFGFADTDGSMQVVLTSLAEHIDSDIFITQVNGDYCVCSDSLSLNEQAALQCPHRNATVSASVMQEVRQGKYRSIGTLNGMYRERQYIVGVPIYYTANNGDQTLMGAAFVTSSTANFTAMRYDIVQMCLIASVFAALISFIVAGVVTYRMVQPLREMSAAAKAFGKGDFSHLITVNSADEVGELAKAMNNMAASLSSSETMSRNFIANVSHELKTPMTTIAGFIDGILDGTIPPEQEKQYLTIVSGEVKRLGRLVRSMLQLSKIDQGEMRLTRTEFSLKDVLIDSLISFEKVIEEKQVSIEGLEEMDDRFINGDMDLLHQVVYNLVDNAVKFVDEGGTISAKLSETEEKTTLMLRNTGAGIAAADLPLVFDRFYKTDKSRSRDKNGMGLGLYLVRTIVQLHQGEIRVNSVENEFTEFTVILPKQPNEEIQKGQG